MNTYLVVSGPAVGTVMPDVTAVLAPAGIVLAMMAALAVLTVLLGRDLHRSRPHPRRMPPWLGALPRRVAVGLLLVLVRP